MVSQRFEVFLYEQTAHLIQKQRKIESDSKTTVKKERRKEKREAEMHIWSGYKLYTVPYTVHVKSIGF